MTTKNEMQIFLINEFKRNNKKSKFLLDDLKSYKAFLNRKTLSELKETYERQKAIKNASESEFIKEFCAQGLF